MTLSDAVIGNNPNIYRDPIMGRIYMAIGRHTVRLTRGFIPQRSDILANINAGRTEGIGWELI